MELLVLLGAEAAGLAAMFAGAEAVEWLRQHGRNRRTGSRLPEAFWRHLRTW